MSRYFLWLASTSATFQPFLRFNAARVEEQAARTSEVAFQPFLRFNRGGNRLLRCLSVRLEVSTLLEIQHRTLEKYENGRQNIPNSDQTRWVSTLLEIQPSLYPQRFRWCYRDMFQPFLRFNLRQLWICFDSADHIVLRCTCRFNPS